MCCTIMQDLWTFVESAVSALLWKGRKKGYMYVVAEKGDMIILDDFDVAERSMWLKEIGFIRVTSFILFQVHFHSC